MEVAHTIESFYSFGSYRAVLRAGKKSIMMPRGTFPGERYPSA
jgi:hypothetical protein